MTKRAEIIIVGLALSLLLPLGCGISEEVKKPAVAGSFYPAPSFILSEMVDGFLKTAEVEEVGGQIFAIISPHAGYIYSGAVAGYGFKAIKGKGFKTVIIIGPSHYVPFQGFSVWNKGSFRTPLGDVPVDDELSSKLIEKGRSVKFFPEAFTREHSLEVQIPFLQTVLKDFKIVPIVTGMVSYSDCRNLAAAIVQEIGNRDDVIIVASTDMSHFHSYDVAVAMDNKTISILEDFDIERLSQKTSSRECELCGVDAAIVAMMAAKQLGANRIKLLKYANSGDVTGDRKRVVGYMSAVIYREGPGRPGKAERAGETSNQRPGERLEAKKQGGQGMLNQNQRNRLLQIARETITAYLRDGKRLEVTESDPVLNKEMGTFVTLHNHGQLRGCIGNMTGRGPLYLLVRDMAIEATEDPRFVYNPVTFKELRDIDIEISVLSPMEKIKNPERIEMGRHGVLVRRGFRSGVYLPQVATETGWTREEFLTSLCAHKAGLPPDAWKKGECEIYIFEAEVFGEKNR